MGGMVARLPFCALGFRAGARVRLPLRAYLEVHCTILTVQPIYKPLKCPSMVISAVISVISTMNLQVEFSEIFAGNMPPPPPPPLNPKHETSPETLSTFAVLLKLLAFQGYVGMRDGWMGGRLGAS